LENISIITYIDKEILNASVDSTKKVYNQYKRWYDDMNNDVHTEESVLAFLKICKKECKFAPITLDCP
jgi:hypothetical protein